LGTAGFAKYYLRHDGSRIFDQRRAGSDACEHHFANITNMGAQTSIAQMRVASAASAVVRMDGNLYKKKKANTGGDDADYQWDEVNAPLIKAVMPSPRYDDDDDDDEEEDEWYGEILDPADCDW
jgi:hypothetical protein